MKYKVEYSGFCYIEADSKSEVEDLFFEESQIYDECEITTVEEVKEFSITM